MIFSYELVVQDLQRFSPLGPFTQTEGVRGEKRVEF